MRRTIILGTSLLMLAVLAVLPSLKAQTTTIVSSDSGPARSVPSDSVSADEAVWQVRLNVHNLFNSPFGPLINQVINKETPGGKDHIDAAVQALGFDPRTSVQEILIFGDSFEHTSATAIANLGENRGNVEGWLLAAPGYQSEEVGDTILHSIDVADKDIPRLWCAIPQTNAKNYVMIAGFNADRVRALVSQATTDPKAFAGKLSETEFLSLAVNDLSKAPIEVDEDQPGSAIIKMIQSIVLNVGSQGNQLTSACEIKTDSAARAEQLNQLIAGMKAMVQLGLPQKDPEMKELVKYLDALKVDYEKGSTDVVANFAMDFDVIKTLIEEELVK